MNTQSKITYIFYKNQIHINYKQDESSLRNIIKNYTTPLDPNKKSTTQNLTQLNLYSKIITHQQNQNYNE